MRTLLLLALFAAALVPGSIHGQEVPRITSYTGDLDSTDELAPDIGGAFDWLRCLSLRSGIRPQCVITHSDEGTLTQQRARAMSREWRAMFFSMAQTYLAARRTAAMTRDFDSLFDLAKSRMAGFFQAQEEEIRGYVYEASRDAHRQADLSLDITQFARRLVSTANRYELLEGILHDQLTGIEAIHQFAGDMTAGLDDIGSRVGLESGVLIGTGTIPSARLRAAPPLAHFSDEDRSPYMADIETTIARAAGLAPSAMRTDGIVINNPDTDDPVGESCPIVDLSLEPAVIYHRAEVMAQGRSLGTRSASAEVMSREDLLASLAIAEQESETFLSRMGTLMTWGRW